MVLNNPENYESVFITIDPVKHPIAYKNRVDSFVNIGLSKEEAEKIASEPIEMEMYFDVNAGLFMLEAEACDGCCSGGLYNPYNGEEMFDELDVALKKTRERVYANFDSEIYEIMYEYGSYTGFQATSYEGVLSVCEEQNFELIKVEGLDNDE